MVEIKVIKEPKKLLEWNKTKQKLAKHAFLKRLMKHMICESDLTKRGVNDTAAFMCSAVITEILK